MFYIKSQTCDLYFTGEFDRSFPPNPYLGTVEEAFSFETREDALNWLHMRVQGGKIIEEKDIPEADKLKGDIYRLRENMRELANAAAFLWDSATEEQKKRFFEMVKEIAWRY